MLVPQKEREGLWWPAWKNWLVNHSSNKIKPPLMGASKKGYSILKDAPGVM
jgi:polyhydroxyalkanoate synthase